MFKLDKDKIYIFYPKDEEEFDELFSFLKEECKSLRGATKYSSRYNINKKGCVLKTFNTKIWQFLFSPSDESLEKGIVVDISELLGSSTLSNKTIKVLGKEYYKTDIEEMLKFVEEVKNNVP